MRIRYLELIFVMFFFNKIEARFKKINQDFIKSIKIKLINLFLINKKGIFIFCFVII